MRKYWIIAAGIAAQILGVGNVWAHEGFNGVV